MAKKLTPEEEEQLRRLQEQRAQQRLSTGAKRRGTLSQPSAVPGGVPGAAGQTPDAVQAAMAARGGRIPGTGAGLPARQNLPAGVGMPGRPGIPGAQAGIAPAGSMPGRPEIASQQRPTGQQGLTRQSGEAGRMGMAGPGGTGQPGNSSVPGAAAGMPPEQAAAMEQAAAPPKIGREEIIKATHILQKYKSGKAHLEQRIVSSENWWKLRHWAEMPDGNPGDKKPVSAWLFNVIMGKHADAIEAYPEPNILPREEGDRAEARKLTSILPVVLEQNDFESTYSDCSWQKMKSGTGIYGVFWDKTKLSGLGDITIRRADALNLFWKPGITDIESSPHLFSVEAVDNEELISHYPQLEGQLGGSTITVSKYIYDDHVDTSDTSVVVDWYYKKYIGGRTVLHYCKFVNDTVLYASENIPELQDRGYYDDGEYPFVFDPLFPIEGSPCGYGYIDIGKSPQESIDQLNQAIVKNAIMAATPRYFIRQDGSVNEQEFADWTKPLVHVNGNLGEDTLKQIMVNPLASIYVGILNNKVEELKQTSGNQDVQNGATSGGVTAASAIAALQESAGRSSRASTKSAYRAYSKLITKCIERIRQFYDMPRQFRILGQFGSEQYASYSNQGLQKQNQGTDFGVDMGYRLPVFDVEVRAQKASPYSKLSQNELALQFFQLGFFNPKLLDQSLCTLDMMQFEGKDGLMQKLAQNGTLSQQLQQYQQMALALAAKYEPEMAQGLMQKIMGGAAGGAGLMGAMGGMGLPASGGAATEGGAPAPSGGGRTPAPAQGDELTGGVKKENKRVEDARIRSNSASQPG